MRHSIDRTDHITDMADVLAIVPAGAAMSLADIQGSALACLDAFEVSDSVFERMAWRLESYIADESALILADVHAVSDEDAGADEYPLQLVIYGAREFTQ